MEESLRNLYRMDSYLVIVHGTHVDVAQIDGENVQL